MVTLHGFGQDQSGLPMLDRGWAQPEATFTWSNGAAVTLSVPVPPGAGDPVIELRLKPFVAPPDFAAQRVRITLGGEAQPEERLWELTCLGYRLPGELWARGGTLPVRFDLPDRTSPAKLGAGADARELGVALFGLRVTREPAATPTPPQRRAKLPVAAFDFSPSACAAVRGMTALEPRELMLAMESIGHNCEFGLFQRRFEAEPLGLLRFTSIRPDRLIDALDADFAGAADPDLLELVEEGQPRLEYMVRNRAWGMHSHTFRYPDEAPPGSVLAELSRKLRFQLRRFLDILKTGEKLFVFHDFHAMTAAQALPILLALKRHGPNALLFVSEEESAAAGAVELIAADLYKGFVSRFAPVWAADDTDVTAWVSVCANAYRLWREQGFGQTT